MQKCFFFLIQVLWQGLHHEGLGRDAQAAAQSEQEVQGEEGCQAAQSSQAQTEVTTSTLLL